MQLLFEPMLVKTSSGKGFHSLPTRCTKESSFCLLGLCLPCAVTAVLLAVMGTVIPCALSSGHSWFSKHLPCSPGLSFGYLVIPHMKSCSHLKSSLLFYMFFTSLSPRRSNLPPCSQKQFHGSDGAFVACPECGVCSDTGIEKSCFHHYPAPLVFAAGQHVDHGSLGHILQMVKKHIFGFYF